MNPHIFAEPTDFKVENHQYIFWSIDVFRQNLKKKPISLPKQGLSDMNKKILFIFAKTIKNSNGNKKILLLSKRSHPVVWITFSKKWKNTTQNAFVFLRLFFSFSFLLGPNQCLCLRYGWVEIQEWHHFRWLLHFVFGV